MTDHPILFSTPMVRALLDGRKTQTRRAVKGRPENHNRVGPVSRQAHVASPEALDHCPYGQPGDRLWVRETWGWDWYDDGQSRAWKRPVYRADPGAIPTDNGDATPWRPSIHMPRHVSRITLEIAEVRVERLQDISESDAVYEGLAWGPGGWWSGFDGSAAPDPVSAYALLWNHINGRSSWDANPWVWVVRFSVIKANIDARAAA